MFDDYVAAIEPVKEVEKGALLNTAALAREGHQFLTDHPMYIFEPQVTVEKIVALDRDGALPSLSGLRASDRYTVLARTGLVVAPNSLADLPSNPAAVKVGDLHGALGHTGRRARRLRRPRGPRPAARVQLLTDGGVAVGVRGDGTLLMRVARPDGRVRGEDVVATLDPDAEQVLSIGPIDAAADGAHPAGGNHAPVRRVVKRVGVGVVAARGRCPWGCRRCRRSPRPSRPTPGIHASTKYVRFVEQHRKLRFEHPVAVEFLDDGAFREGVPTRRSEGHEARPRRGRARRRSAARARPRRRARRPDRRRERPRRHHHGRLLRPGAQAALGARDRSHRRRRARPPWSTSSPTPSRTSAST